MGSNDAVIFSNDHFFDSFRAFDDMRVNNELCDLTLKVKSRTIRAHRVIVAATIPYFRTLFKTSTDATGEIVTIAEHLDPSAVKSLIHFAYTRRVSISVENVRYLLLASVFLQLDEVKSACVTFLSERLHLVNIFEVYILACNVNDQRLTENCYDFIRQNFEEFSKRNDFVSLPDRVFKNIVSKDCLNISSEETVFEAVIKWVKSSPRERQDALPQLLKEVRMIYLSSDVMERVTTEELITDSASCRDFVHEVQRYHVLPKTKTVFLKNLKTTPRCRSEKMYAVCSETSQGYSVWCCDFIRRRWDLVKAEHLEKDKIHHVVGNSEYMYCFLSDRIKTFDFKTLEWEELEPRHEGIIGAAVLMHCNVIYCFSSIRGQFSENVRLFDTSQKIWLQERPMEESRFSCSAVSVEGCVYVSGGCSREERLSRIFQRYNPSNGKWTKMSPMLTPRSEHRSTSVNGKIYVCGGCTFERGFLSHSKTAEMYDPNTNLWNVVPSMNVGKMYFSLVSYNCKIYALGGESDQFQNLQHWSEFYDPECDDWMAGFGAPTGFHQAVVIRTMLN